MAKVRKIKGREGYFLDYHMKDGTRVIQKTTVAISGLRNCNRGWPPRGSAATGAGGRVRYYGAALSAGYDG